MDGGFTDEAGEESLLISQILSGEKELFRLLVRRYQNVVYALGMSFFHNADDCSDFSQDVFLKAYRNLASFKGKARFSTWLYRIAYNTAINGVTRRKEYKSLAEEEEADSEERSPEGLALRAAAKKAIRSAVGELPEKYRVCVDLFFFYDRSIKEIEAITGFPENTVKSHIFRAKALLREQLKELK